MTHGKGRLKFRQDYIERYREVLNAKTSLSARERYLMSTAFRTGFTTALKAITKGDYYKFKEKNFYKKLVEENASYQYRSDGRVEWICPHGVGHTIYDPSGTEFVHGCDFCCEGLKGAITCEKKR